MLVTAAALLLAAPAADAADSATKRLINSYVPILMLRQQDDPPCDTSGEQYQPTTVDSELGNPQVALVDEGKNRTRLIKRAPTAADIAGLDGDYYLNLPGDPLNAQCDYAKDFVALKKAGGAPAITYARIATEKGWPGHLVVQYWFFYYFNEFNDLHEGDWEGMQIAFKASDPAQALKTGPYEIALFQHAGGEKASWDDDKVQKQGSHPVVYPAAGSHATFYDSAVYVENGQHGSGVGCDNTKEPLRRLIVRPQLIPTRPSAHGPFKWLTYEGHWGQKEKGFNTGPTGPNTKTVWSHPLSWMDGIRTASPTLPGGGLLGPPAVSVFCGAVATVSQFINLEARSPLGLLLLLSILALLVLVPALVTRWRPVDLSRLRRPRSFGQLVRTARQLYGRHWRVFVPIGLTAIPIIAGIEGLQALLKVITGSDELHPAISIGGFHLDLTIPLAGVGRPLGFAVVGAGVIMAVRQLDESGQTGLVAVFRGVRRQFWRVVAGQLLVNVLLVLLLITFIGIPIAVWKYFGWQFVQQEILFKDQSIREAFRGSSKVVHGHWWRTVLVVGFFWLLSAMAGPVLGFILIFTNFSLTWVNLIGSVVFGLLIPFVAIGRTLLYFDLEAREQGEEVEKAPSLRGLGRSRPSPQLG